MKRKLWIGFNYSGCMEITIFPFDEKPIKHVQGEDIIFCSKDERKDNSFTFVDEEGGIIEALFGFHPEAGKCYSLNIDYTRREVTIPEAEY